MVPVLHTVTRDTRIIATKADAERADDGNELLRKCESVINKAFKLTLLDR